MKLELRISVVVIKLLMMIFREIKRTDNFTPTQEDTWVDSLQILDDIKEGQN